MNEGVAARLRRNRTAYLPPEPPTLYQRSKRPPSALFQRTDGLMLPIPMATGLLANHGTGPQRHVARWPGHAQASEEGEEVWRAQLRLALALLDRADGSGMIPGEATAQSDAVRSTLRGRLQQHVTPHSTPSTDALLRAAKPGGPSYGDERYGGAFARVGSGGSGVAGPPPPPPTHHSLPPSQQPQPQPQQRQPDTAATHSSTQSQSHARAPRDAHVAAAPSLLGGSASSPALLPPPGVVLHPPLDLPPRSRPGSAMRPGVLAGTALYDGWDGRRPAKAWHAQGSHQAGRPRSAFLPPTAAASSPHHPNHPCHSPPHSSTSPGGGAVPPRLRPESAATTSAMRPGEAAARAEAERRERTREALEGWKRDLREQRLAFSQSKRDSKAKERAECLAARRSHVESMSDEVRACAPRSPVPSPACVGTALLPECAHFALSPRVRVRGRVHTRVFACVQVRWLRSHSVQKRTIPATIRLGELPRNDAAAAVVTDTLLANFGKPGEKALTAAERLLESKPVPVDIEAKIRGGCERLALECLQSSHLSRKTFSSPLSLELPPQLFITHARSKGPRPCPYPHVLVRTHAAAAAAACAPFRSGTCSASLSCSTFAASRKRWRPRCAKGRSSERWHSTRRATRRRRCSTKSASCASTRPRRSGRACATSCRLRSRPTSGWGIC